MTETIYALYPVFAASPELRAELFEDDALRDAAEEIEALFKDWAGRVDVRGMELPTLEETEVVEEWDTDEDTEADAMGEIEGVDA